VSSFLTAHQHISISLPYNGLHWNDFKALNGVIFHRFSYSCISFNSIAASSATSLSRKAAICFTDKIRNDLMSLWTLCGVLVIEKTEPRQHCETKRSRA